MKTTNKWGHYGLNIQVDTTFIMNEQYIYIYIYIYIYVSKLVSEYVYIPAGK